MKFRLLAAALSLLLLGGCAAGTVPGQGPRRFEASFLTLFDTVTTIVGYAETEEDFRRTAQQLHDELLEYHQMFDIYHEYAGINNLKTVNDRAGASLWRWIPGSSICWCSAGSWTSLPEGGWT